MRKLLSIVLLAVLGLPFVSPLFAQGTPDDSRLPACCRRGGAHRCGMPGEAGAPPSAHAPGERCPYCPGALIAPHTEVFAAPALPATLPRESASHALTAGVSQWASATSLQEHHPRGPPSFLL